ncbi:hypothetical protein HDV02_004992 [Globomyces sp. JEL0801]|nr:hypothetical protein HDV02_004992 [Globomyces sp. JEL0801]
MDIKQLNKNAEINIDHSKNLILYLRSADMLFKQANIYYLELDYKRAYVLYLKYSNLVISKIKLHPQYSIQNLQNSIQKLRSNAIIAMDRIEIIKPILLKQHQDEINKQNDLKESIKKEKELKQKQFEFEQEQKILKEQHEILTRMNEININTKTDDWWKSHDVNNNSNPLDHIAPVNNQTQIDYSTKSTPLYQTTNTNTTSLYQTNDTTIHQTDISNSLLPPPIPAKPSNIHQYLNENTTISESHVTSPPNLFIPNPNDANTKNLYTNITTDNPPPIPPKPDLYQSPAGGTTPYLHSP